jgi:SPW repeat-containing protein
MSTERLPIEEHPDIATLRGRYDEVGVKPAAQAASGITMLAGLFVALSPWIVGFSGQTTLAVNNLVVGLVITLLGLGFATTFSATHSLSWVVKMLGIWTIIAPWVAAGTTATLRVILANVIGGAVVLLCGLAVTGAGLMRRKT